MGQSSKGRPAAPRDAETAEPTIDTQIRRFVNGTTNGRDVLGALYDRILDEPVPQRLKDLLRK